MDLRGWLSLKLKGVCDIQFTFMQDMLYVVHLNYFRVVSIITNQTVFEAFFNREVKKIIQVDGIVYLIKDSPVCILSTFNKDHTFKDVAEIEGSLV